jgi:hypothetical protein
LDLARVLDGVAGERRGPHGLLKLGKEKYQDLGAGVVVGFRLELGVDTRISEH